MTTHKSGTSEGWLAAQTWWRREREPTRFHSLGPAARSRATEGEKRELIGNLVRRTLVIFIRVALCASIPIASDQAAAQPLGAPEAQMPAPQFDYRIGFWRNLHHTLYAMSTSHPAAGKVRKIEVRPADIASLERLNPEERAIWSDTVAFYAANLVHRNLLFDDEMVAVGEALSMAGSDPRLDEAIPADLRQRLMQAAPIYRKYWWPEHQNVSAQWKEAVEPLLALHGQMLAARMSELYQVPWPATPVETNLSVYANSAGAYTIVKPTRITVATGDSTYAGHAALEMLLHETGHGMVDPLRAQLELASKAAANRPGANMDAVRRDLWHELLFYITGEIVADAVPGYVPYADKNELWRFAWPGPDRQAIERHLPPYIEGKTTLESALAGLTRELAATPAETGHQYRGRGRFGQQAIRTRVVDEIAISLAPVILGAGTKLFDDFERHIHLEPITLILRWPPISATA